LGLDSRYYFHRRNSRVFCVVTGEGAMKERPILMQGWGVRAILEDLKTLTLRVAQQELWPLFQKSAEINGHVALHMMGCDITCPYGQPGDLLWVRETWTPCDCGASYCPGYIYRADGDPALPNLRWHSPLYMPKKATRLWLRITSVRIERLQEISDRDIEAEGYAYERYRITQLVSRWPYGPAGKPELDGKGRDWLISVWDSINAKRGYSLEDDPYVWAIEFERTR
jgi:hypothetical protein